MKTDLLRELIDLVPRKYAGMLAGACMMALVLVQWPQTYAAAQQYIGGLGLGTAGVVMLLVSFGQSVKRDKRIKETIIEATMTPPPAVKPSTVEVPK
jgi:hypothetical protein